MSSANRLEELYTEYAAERDAAYTPEEHIRAIHHYYIRVYQVFINSLLLPI